jgi:hypothetical protein
MPEQYSSLDMYASSLMPPRFTSLPCAQDAGGENPYIDTKDVLGLLIVDNSAVWLLVTLGARSAWRKAGPTAKVLLEAKAAALYPERYQSLLSKLSTTRVRRGKEAQAIGLASQSDGQKSDGQAGDRQTG